MVATLTVSTPAFFESLKKSNLLSGKQVAHLRAMAMQSERVVEPTAVAEALVKKRMLTRWQATQLLAGKHAFFLGKYKLLERIGTGGMGQVFKAEHTNIGHVVALKVVSKQRLSQPGAIARFSREIQAAAALHHPNIIAAFDADKVGDTHFLVMEYVDGRDLNGWLKQHTMLPIDWSCECIRQAALGLQHAHEQGMVHRDIKPGNLVVTQDPETGQPITKILDMGLARFTSEAKNDGDITQTGQILGTPDYIAPEQARDTKNADIRADIFSLGCTLFRILTGTLPFAGDNPVEKLVARYTQDAPLLRTLRPEAPAELEAVLAKMMARDLKQRYQLPYEVADALAPFTMSQGVKLAEVDSEEGSVTRMAAQFPKEESDSEEKEGSSATCEFLNLLAHVRAPEGDTPHVAGDTTGSLPNVTRGKGKAAATRVARYPHRQPSILLLIEEKFADLPLAAKVVVGAACIAIVLIAGMMGRRAWERSGETTLAIDWPAEQRGEYSQANVDGLERPIPATGAIEFKGSSGPRRVVLTRRGYEPFVFEETLARGATKTVVPVWHPTAATVQKLRIEADAKKRAEEYGLLAGEVARLKNTSPSIAQASAIRLKLDSFIARWPGTTESALAAKALGDFPVPLDRLSRQNLPADYGPLAQSVPLVGVFGVAADDRLRHGGLISCVAESADGRYLASASLDDVKIWNAATGQLYKSLSDKQRTAGLAFSPSGRLLATLSYGTRGPSINIWDVETGAHLHSLAGVTPLSRIVFQPKSEATLAGALFDGSIAIWNAAAGGTPTRTIKAHGRIVTALAFSADGKHLYTAGQGLVAPQPNQAITPSVEPIRIWDFEKGTQLSTIDEKILSTAGLVVSADEKYLAVVDAPKKTVRVWDLAARTSREIALGEIFPHNIDLSPDGKILAIGCPNLQTIRLVDFASGTLLGDISGARAWGQSFTFVGKNRVAFAGYSSFNLRLYDTVQKSEMVGEQGQGHQQPVVSLSFSPGGETLASVGLDQRLLLWDTATGQSRAANPQVPGAYAALFSPDGATLAVSTVNQQLVLLDARTGAVRKMLPGMQYIQNQPTAWAFSKDSKKLVVAWSGPTLKVIDSATGAELKTLPKRASTISALAINSDGTRMAVAEHGQPQISLLDTATWTEPSPAKGVTSSIVANQGTVRAMAFSPDGFLLVTAGDDSTLKFWNAKTYAKAADDQPESVRAMSMTGTKTMLATCNDTGLVTLWNYLRAIEVNSYQLPQYFQVVGNENQPIRSVNQLAFSPDGRHLATANGNGTLYILRLADSAARPAGVANTTSAGSPLR